MPYGYWKATYKCTELVKPRNILMLILKTRKVRTQIYNSNYVMYPNVIAQKKLSKQNKYVLRDQFNILLWVK